MPGHARRRYAATTALAAAITVFAVAACGDDDDEKSSAKPTTLSVTTTDLGKKRFKMAAPKSIEGGAVTLRFRNASKVPHEAQIISLDGGHTAQEALEIVQKDKVVLPDWFRGEGGVGGTPPGQSGTATVKLPAGDYGIIDTETAGDEKAPPPSARGAIAEFKVTGDNGAKLKDTSTKVVIKDKGEDEFEFVTSGLKAGTNNLTFDNRSKQIHHVLAFPVIGNAKFADVKKFLEEQGKSSGPPPLDFENSDGTAVLDGKRKETTQLEVKKGRNVLVCFLMDRDGKGKSHVSEGLLKEVDLK